MAVLVSVVHSVTMIAAGGILAWHLGLVGARGTGSLNDLGLSLILIRVLSVAINLASQHGGR